MKKIITSAALLTAAFSCSYAQPVITSGNLPPVGFSDSIGIVTSGVNPGSAGANMTWNFSALSPTMAGKATFVSPSSTPFAAQFPASNSCIKIEIPGNTVYEYDIISANKWEMLANNVTASSGENYTPNPKTMIPFPFHFNDVVTDTFQKTGSSPGTVVMTYDGYGTLVTPFATISNVVRLKRSFGGSDFYYDWYNTSPLLYIAASFDNNTGKLTIVGNPITTSVEALNVANYAIQVFPNPIHGAAMIKINTTQNLKEAKLILTDITGRTVKMMDVHQPEMWLNCSDLPSGLFVYNLMIANNCVAKGKMIVE